MYRLEKFVNELVNQLNSVTKGKKVKQETEKWTDFFTYTKLSTNAIRITLWPDLEHCTQIDFKAYDSKHLDLGVRGCKFKCCLFVIDAMKPSILIKSDSNDSKEKEKEETDSKNNGMSKTSPVLGKNASKELFNDIMSGRKGDLKTVYGYLSHLMFLRETKLLHKDCEFLFVCDNSHNPNATTVDGMFEVPFFLFYFFCFVFICFDFCLD